MLNSYKYRLYPNRQQEGYLKGIAGACRWAFNEALSMRIKAYESDGKGISGFDSLNRINALKKESETEWLADYPNQALSRAVLDVDSAYKNFFSKRTKFPKFRKKGGREAFSFDRSFRIEEGKVRIPNLGFVKAKIDREPVGNLKRMTISKDPSGKWFASITFDDLKEVPDAPYPTEENTVGIDLGVKDLAILSNGKKFANPKFTKKYAERIAVISKRLARKKKGSVRREKAKIKLAKVHEKLRNSRTHAIHEIVNEVLNEFDCIALETLSPSNMVKNRKLSKAIQDASFGELNRIFEYKAGRLGKRIIRSDRFDATSKTCSCGVKNQDLKLNERIWTCHSCQKTHDRDILGAENVKKFALARFYAT